MAHPSLAVVTYGSNHAESCCELARVLHNAVAGLHHALHFPAFCTDWQALESGTEVTESSVFLFPGALVTFHDSIARVFTQVDPGGISSNCLLTELLLFRLLPLARFLLRHDGEEFWKQVILIPTLPSRKISVLLYLFEKKN